MKKITVLHSDDPTIERTNRAYPIPLASTRRYAAQALYGR